MLDELRTKNFSRARLALADVRDQVMSRSALLGVGVGVKVVRGEVTDEPCIKTFVTRKIPLKEIPPGQAVPPVIASAAGTVRTDVEEMLPPTGPPWFRNPYFDYEPFWIGNPGRRRPFSGGDSVSHPLAPLGTVSAEVIDPTQPNLRYVLSCNHVLAALNRARPGDPIVQPASGDGGRVPADVCGFVDRWVPVYFGQQGVNLVDAAIAQVYAWDVLPQVDWLGIPTGVRSGNSMKPGDVVSKVGRTTYLTVGTVVAVDVSIWISYPALLGGAGPALFAGQIVTTGMAGFGDSGSLLFDSYHNAVGLLFGGSPTHTFYNDILSVQNALRIQIALR